MFFVGKQVKWSVDNPAPLLASTDYDGVVRLWDMRGSVALAAQQAHDGKALCVDWVADRKIVSRSEEHTSELQSLMRISYAVFCLKKKHLIYLPNMYQYSR